MMSRSRTQPFSTRERNATRVPLVVVLIILALLTFIRVPVMLAVAGLGLLLEMEFSPTDEMSALALLDLLLFGSLGLSLALCFVPAGEASYSKRRWWLALALGLPLTVAVCALSGRRLPTLVEVSVPVLSCIMGVVLATLMAHAPSGRRRLKYVAWLMIIGSVGIVFWYVNTGLALNLKAAVVDQLRTMRLIAQHTLSDDHRFGSWMHTSFAYARKRSNHGDAVLHNKAAILALGFVIGHQDMQELSGVPIGPDIRDWAKTVRGRITLRDRKDWPRHFTVSAALLVLSDQEVSDTIGHLKEEFDAIDGSGFSFTDLMANRAGIRFAKAAIRDEETARAVQSQLAETFKVDDYFPVAADLPEGITQAEFQATYGGVGGPLYRQIEREIEQRLEACQGLQ